MLPGALIAFIIGMFLVTQVPSAMNCCSPRGCVNVQCPYAGSSRCSCQATKRHAQRLLGIHWADLAQVPRACSKSTRMAVCRVAGANDQHLLIQSHRRHAAYVA